MQNFRVKGFSVVELFITFAVVGILAAIAYPAYKNYTKRSYYSNLVQAAVSVEDSISACFQKEKNLSACNGGRHHIPANIRKPKGPIASLKIKWGVITLTPVPQKGITLADTYVLTPVVAKNKLSWKTSGGAVTNGYAD